MSTDGRKQMRMSSRNATRQAAQQCRSPDRPMSQHSRKWEKCSDQIKHSHVFFFFFLDLNVANMNAEAKLMMMSKRTAGRSLSVSFAVTTFQDSIARITRRSHSLSPSSCSPGIADQLPRPFKGMLLHVLKGEWDICNDDDAHGPLHIPEVAIPHLGEGPLQRESHAG